MGVDEDPRPSGIVFRRLGTPAERSRARALLDAAGPAYRSPRLAGDEVWFGLFDLTAANGAALTAAAATLPTSARVLEARALVWTSAHWSQTCGRLVRELADVCRAHGAEWMVAAVADGDTAAVHLLRRAGFDTTSDPGLPDTGSIEWLMRDV
ncbi:GNAT family N-acetyltransferase [Paractinoplanes maris]|uniref:GNAT family N-acetyltransferase n=1 Tax=Paractinoplanes maris TaxID=1734446 RepID=UPI0020201C30|nr:GNAT family N-acetyltransferase [Actinoplanes maris]